MDYMRFEGPGFVMQVPTNWLITSSPDYQVMFRGPRTSSASRPNLIVTLRPANTDVTIEAIASKTRATQEREYPDFELLTQDTRDDPLRVQHVSEYTWRNPNNDQLLYQIQGLLLSGNVVITLTGTTLTQFADDLRPVFQHMIDSLVLTPPAE